MQEPCATSAAMPIDSPSVGCGWIVLPMSTASAPISIASATSPIMSPACVPTMPPPTMRSLAASNSSLVKPSSRPLAIARPDANGRDEGITKLLFDDSPEAHGHGRILGGGIVGTHAGDMIGEVALAIEMGADAVDIGKTIHPHPTLGESIGLAAEAFEGACTDLPPVRR